MCNNCGLIYSNPRMDKESTEYFYNTDIYRKIYDGDNFVEDQIKELSN